MSTSGYGAVTRFTPMGIPSFGFTKLVTGTGAITLPALEVSGVGGEPTFINDILISDGLAIFASEPALRQGLFSQKFNNEVKQDNDLIKMWDGLGSL